MVEYEGLNSCTSVAGLHLSFLLGKLFWQSRLL